MSYQLGKEVNDHRDRLPRRVGFGKHHIAIRNSPSLTSLIDHHGKCSFVGCLYSNPLEESGDEK
jgi:hypothetical protein